LKNVVDTLFDEGKAEGKVEGKVEGKAEGLNIPLAMHQNR